MEEESTIVRLIRKGGIYKDIAGKTPEQIYKNLLERITLPEGISSEQVYNALCAREKILSTAVGNGIALPHARTPILKNDDDQMIIVIYLDRPVDMNTPDEKEVTTMFVLLTSNAQTHLRVLTSLAGLFRSVRFRKALELKSDVDTLAKLIKELD